MAAIGIAAHGRIVAGNSAKPQGNSFEHRRLFRTAQATAPAGVPATARGGAHATGAGAAAAPGTVQRRADATGRPRSGRTTPAERTPEPGIGAGRADRTPGGTSPHPSEWSGGGWG